MSVLGKARERTSSRSSSNLSRLSEGLSKRHPFLFCYVREYLVTKPIAQDHPERKDIIPSSLAVIGSLSQSFNH